jgi:hypothetical protein
MSKGIKILIFAVAIFFAIKYLFGINLASFTISNWQTILMIFGGIFVWNYIR